MSEAKRTGKYNINFGTAVVGGLLVLAALSQAKLQVFESKSTVEMANKKKRFVKEEILFAKRGTIYSSNGKALATDDETYQLRVSFSEVPHTPAFWMDVSEASGIPLSEFEAQEGTTTGNRSWPKPLSEAERKAIDQVRTDWRADGLAAAPMGTREYPLGSDASLIVGVRRLDRDQIKKGDLGWNELVALHGVPARGYFIRERDKSKVNPGDLGYNELVEKYDEPKSGFFLKPTLSGLESALNANLKGENGVKVGLKDRNGLFLPMQNFPGNKPKQDGEDVVLTIDSSLQQAATKAIKEAVEKQKADNGAAIILDPQTGDLLAMASWPAFSPYSEDGAPGEMSPKNTTNAATMCVFEPGSTMKVLTLAMALNDGKVHMNDTTFCSGTWFPAPKVRVRCDSSHGAHGLEDPKAAIAKSCNVAAAQWATKIGRDKLIEYIEQLGLNSKTRIGIGEVRSRYNENDPAKLLQLTRLGYGQALSATPVGLAGGFSAIGNGGFHITPRLVKRIGDKDQPILNTGRVFSEETSKQVLDCMEAVFSSEKGTGHGLRIPGYRLAGKTGTAQKIGKGQTGHVANFVGFVPAIKPKVEILVMVNNPRNAYYGASVAGPVFRQLALNVISHYKIAPTEPIELPKNKVAPSTAKKVQNDGDDA